MSALGNLQNKSVSETKCVLGKICIQKCVRIIRLKLMGGQWTDKTIKNSLVLVHWSV